MMSTTATTMRSVVLQKKLHELETELAAVFRLPSTNARQHVPLDNVEQRFIFLQKLLAAETNAVSLPESSGQLQDIAGRLAALKAEFRESRETINSTNPNDQDDTFSICSDCTQDLLYCDDVREVGSPLISEGNRFPGEKSPWEVAPMAEAVATAAEEKIWSKLGKCCGVFGCGMIVGALCTVHLVSFYGDYFVRYEAFLIPPT